MVKVAWQKHNDVGETEMYNIIPFLTAEERVFTFQRAEFIFPKFAIVTVYLMVILIWNILVQTFKTIFISFLILYDDNPTNGF